MPLFLLLAALLLAGCGDDSTGSNGSSGGNGGKGGWEKNVCDTGAKTAGEPCGFAADDDVWRYVYASWGYVRIYVWAGADSVEVKTCLNSYHMADEDSSYVVSDRAAFHAGVLEDCLYYTQERD
ncbi:MAG: hypothetical protein J6V65_02535 [Fibrobacterales bacterium]|nr:hypothetical protein [Fibrobacterales bacterium]